MEDVGDSFQRMALNRPGRAGKPALIPLTGSLYVPGEIVNPDSVLVDVGTGYFVTKVGLSEGRFLSESHLTRRSSSSSPTKMHKTFSSENRSF